MRRTRPARIEVHEVQPGRDRQLPGGRRLVAEHGFPESACPTCSPATPPPGAGSQAFAPGTRIRFRSPEIERASGDRDGAGAADPARGQRRVHGPHRLRPQPAGRYPCVGSRGGARGEGRSRSARGRGRRAVRAGERRDRRPPGPAAGCPGARQRRPGSPRAAARAERVERSSPARQVELAREELETEEAELRAIEAGLRITGADGLRDCKAGSGSCSPIAGTVIRRPATIGTFATNAVSLATIADTSRMWAWLEIREADAGLVRIGQPVRIRVDALPAQEFSGASPGSPRRWTPAPARSPPAPRWPTATACCAPSSSPARRSRRGRRRRSGRAPRGDPALGDDSVVFVRTGDGVYEPRLVSLGRSDRERVEIRGAVRDGDPVVTDGAFLLKTELSRESIGAGCCEVGPPTGS